MKQYQALPFFLLLIIAICSCTDPCEEVSCLNGGTCVEGICNCPDGFLGPRCDIVLDSCIVLGCVNGTCIEGSNGVSCNCETGWEGTICDEAWYQKFIGVFNVTQSCGAAGANYVVDISPGPKFNEITISGFNNSPNQKLVGQLIGSRLVNINEQFMSFGRVEGFGSINENYDAISIDFTIDTVSCNAIFTQ